MKIAKAQRDEIKRQMRNTLETTVEPKSDITKEKILAIKTIQSDTSIIILSYDKRKTTLVRDKLEYSVKFANLFGRVTLARRERFQR